MESGLRGSADWNVFTGTLPLAASEASSLVLFRLTHHSAIGELEITRSVERMTGHAAEDFHRNPELLLRLTSDDDRSAMRELLTGSDGEGPRTRVIRIRRRDGETISAVVQTVMKADDDGGRRVYGAMRDVSGWSIEEGLPLDLSTALNALDDGVIYTDLDGRVRFFNRGAEELFGWEADEVLGRPVDEVLWPEEEREALASFAERAFGGESFVQEIPARTKNGERRWHWVSANPVRDASGELQGVLGVSRDVTEERIRREVQREEWERANELLAASPAVIFTAEMDPEGGFATRFISENVARVTGHEAASFTDDGAFWADHLHPDDRERVFEEMERLSEEGRVVSEYRFRCADGEHRWIRDEMHLLERPDGRDDQIVGSMVDITERKEVERELEQATEHLSRRADELEESRGRYREAQAIARLGSATRYVEDDRVEASDELLDIFGFADEDDLTAFQDFLERVHPEDREEALELKRRIDEHGTPIDTEFRIQRPDGDVRWLSARFRAATEDGRVVRVHGTMQDITERKTAELELERFFTVSLDLLCIVSTDGRFVRVNPAFTEILGWSEEELLERPLADFLHPDDRNRTAAAIDEHREDGMVFEAFENRYRTVDGGYRWLMWKAVPDESGERIYAAARDITGRKRAEEEAREVRDSLEQTVRAQTAELRASERRYRKIVEQAPLGIFRTDREGRIFTANSVFARILGYEDADAIEEDLRLAEDVYVDPEDRERLLGVLDRTGELRDEEVRWKTLEGEVIWVRIDEIIAAGADATEEHLLAFVQDITAERALEEQLLQSQKMEAVGTLAGGVAHDFNNLLTPILTNAELGLMDLPPDHPFREDLEDIRDAAKKAAELTSQILSFSRKEDRDARLLDVTEVVAGMKRLLARTLPDDVTVEFHVPDEPCRTRADRNQLEQVIMNLVVNARDAMPDGGRVTLEVSSVDLDQEYTDLHADVDPGPYVLLEVSDTGVGMDAETRSRIFDPFYTTKEVGEGTGLGLSTVYSIVQRSGGQVGVYSEPGQGTVFRVYLPRLDEEGEPDGRSPEAAPADEEPIVDASTRTATILLAEDDDRVRHSAIRVLRKTGYEVLEARNGEEALALFQSTEESIDLLLTDVVMPEMDGGELAERCVDLRPDLRVLFMSGYTEKSLIQRSTMEESARFLQKPFTPTELQEAIQELLGG